MKQKKHCVVILQKGMSQKFIFPWRVIIWYVLQTAKAYFRYMIWFMISKKCITRCTFFCCCSHMHQKSQQRYKKTCVPEFPIFSALNLLSCGLVVFIDMKMYRLTESSNFNTFLKESYAVALENCYLFAKKS